MEVSKWAFTALTTVSDALILKSSLILKYCYVTSCKKQCAYGYPNFFKQGNCAASESIYGQNKVPALMPSCKYASTHKPMVANVCCCICHDCQELVKRKLYFSQFIWVAYKLHSSMPSWSSKQTSRFQTQENSYRYTWNAYNIYANELFIS